MYVCDKYDNNTKNNNIRYNDHIGHINRIYIYRTDINEFL